MAEIGSTMPDNAPKPKARLRVRPSPRSGREIIAPSGIFCIAIPTANAVAAAMLMPVLPVSAPAITAPTAMPSGMLCSVTASINICRLPSDEAMPSRVSVPGWVCGTRQSKASRKSMPSIIPTAAGTQLSLPISAERSRAGIISDHTAAATITPAAKPSNALCRRSEVLSLVKSTVAAPTTVPKKGIAIIVKIFIVVCVL